MKIEIIERVQNENIDIIKFVVDGIPLELANGLRRIILSEVPCMAIDEVIFLENGSPLFDEYIAHRLGLMPLTTDLKNYNLPHKCVCGGVGCTLCQAELTCSVKADLDSTEVKSNELQTTDNKIKPVNGNILITKLQKNSSLMFEAFARLGIGATHAKWQCVSTVGFGYYPDITIDSSKCKKCVDKCISARRCPEKVIEFSGDKAKMIKNYWHTCTLCDSCAKYCPEKAFDLSWQEDKYIFTLEGTGALQLKEILIKATEIFIEKVEEFEGNLSNPELFS